MNRRTFVASLPALGLLARTTRAAEETLQPIVLEKPQMDGGKSVLAALKDRRTNRMVSSQELPLQLLSNLLWAAFGVNRESGPFGQVGRTAASASNSQEIDLYVVLAKGIYLYDAVPHRLVPVAAGDLRPTVAARRRGGAAAAAPVNLFFVADIAKYAQARLQEPGLRDPEVQKAYYYVATGLIAGNVYLFAASQGLAAWFHNCNKEAFAAAVKLRREQRVLFSQTVGYPKSA